MVPFRCAWRAYSEAKFFGPAWPNNPGSLKSASAFVYRLLADADATRNRRVCHDGIRFEHLLDPLIHLGPLVGGHFTLTPSESPRICHSPFASLMAARSSVRYLPSSL